MWGVPSCENQSRAQIQPAAANLLFLLIGEETELSAKNTGSGCLVFSTPRARREAAHFFIGIAGKAKQAYGGKQYSEPAQAENDPKQHYAL